MYPSFHLNYPHYTPLEDELFQQQAFSNGVVAHEHSTRNTTTNVRSTTMENSNYNNGSFVTGTTDGINRSNSRVILGSNGLTGKRSSKKDRHSKIDTARGPRDRRMRLSLDVARKFFKLQDMLGFDKASNTIEWLLMKSKPAIQDLLPDQQLNQGSSLLLGVSNSPPSSASECEVLSGFDDQSMEKAGEDQFVAIDKAKSAPCSSNKEKMKLDRGLKKSAHIHHSLVKETRDKARARARKRTTEKRNNKLGCDQYSKFRTSLDQIMDQNVNRLGSCITFRENQVQTADQHQYPSSHSQLIKQGVVGDNGSLISGNWSPSSLFNYQHNPGPSHEHQLPWEGNNN
ncbi:hypothetical protein OSB04_003317 [Centaurea solstitialis]|uniref:Uncharacterized protein n=1 Tax=Centaurea solstitialis TaxID=347529 RepID=A0AA38WVN3_9ASTR|nr:hypothetical protein OSB04_003317 [Centaurea solstitialis]